MPALADDTSLAGIFPSYLDLRWHLDPVFATAQGLTEHDGRLGDYSEESVRLHMVALKSLAGSLEALEPDSIDDEIDRTALLNDVRVTVQRFTIEQPHVTDPGFWLNHVLEGLYHLLALTDRPHEHRARSARARLEAVPQFFELAKATLADCPQVFVDTALSVVGGGQLLLDQVSEQLAPKSEPGFQDTVAQAKASLASFGRYLGDDLRRSANGEFAIGEDAFNFRLHYEHALRDTAPELWRYGTNLVEEVEQDLVRLGKEIDPSVKWPQLVDRLRAEHPGANELVGAYGRQMARARKFVEAEKLVAIPRGPLDVIETPAFLKPLMPFAAYQPPGAFSADRTGRFFVTPPDRDTDPAVSERILRDHCVHELASTALHEGYPGHHLQFLTALAQPRLVRRVVGTPLTIEGWALYCEEMMGEEGFYGREERFFQRVHLMWRAVRIVLDVGLHTRGMTFHEAVQMLVDRVHFDRHNAEAEVRRYCGTPGYQLCYAVGRREFRALREAYKAARGSAYSLRGFHDAALAYGGLPVSLIKWGMGLGE
ncbi:MAG: DUF885 domain-containing protein [Gemmatimonadetes bacterium]|nr:DUF885 domain-containing protein [Gemmatimonadota bacterium]